MANIYNDVTEYEMDEQVAQNLDVNTQQEIERQAARERANGETIENSANEQNQNVRYEICKGIAEEAIKSNPGFKAIQVALNDYPQVSLSLQSVVDAYMADNKPTEAEYVVSDQSITDLLTAIQISISLQPNGVVFDSAGPIGQVDEVASYYQAKDNQIYNLMDKNDPNMPTELRKEAADKVNDFVILNKLLSTDLKDGKAKIDFSNSYANQSYSKLIEEYIFKDNNYTDKEVNDIGKSLVEKGGLKDDVKICRSKSTLHGIDEVEYMYEIIKWEKMAQDPASTTEEVLKKVDEINLLKGAERFRKKNGSLKSEALDEYMTAYVTKENIKIVSDYLGQGINAFQNMENEERKQLLEAIFQLENETEGNSKIAARVALRQIDPRVGNMYKEGDKEGVSQVFANLYNSTLDTEKNLTPKQIKYEIIAQKKLNMVMAHVEELHEQALEGKLPDMKIEENDDKAHDDMLEKRIKQAQKNARPRLILKREDVRNVERDLQSVIQGKDVSLEELVPALYSACHIAINANRLKGTKNPEVEKAKDLLKEVMLADRGKYGQYVDGDEINLNKIKENVNRREIAQKIDSTIGTVEGRKGKSLASTEAMTVILNRARTQEIRAQNPVSIANFRSSVRDIATVVREFMQERKPVRNFFKQVRDNLTGNQTKLLTAGEEKTKSEEQKEFYKKNQNEIGENDKNATTLDDILAVDESVIEGTINVGKQAGKQQETLNPEKIANERAMAIGNMAKGLRGINPKMSETEALDEATKMYDEKNNQKGKKAPVLETDTVGGDVGGDLGGGR